ncbi:Hypothetical_protein [Hexamita inflata]|uniref:Hypothetical_protein n=1 Tax=Hexamita inflata TaxID=28002 RepID=A0AA86PEW3_9EUKA|nr:Hypothetical protein HINF_LOCUS22450 [Hexamita inflata]CAI9936843.1 Hypothetical protein HINF_LOCUS24488 [Hexamita inflata]CAI9936846.1 Hypothetical protein HINF_LOCUS24491 [Hexamita inflata]CAI9972413.1 Hypothetical protein HINF_LOCUS60058 [Hexamita inflata]
MLISIIIQRIVIGLFSQIKQHQDQIMLLDNFVQIVNIEYKFTRILTLKSDESLEPIISNKVYQYYSLTKICYVFDVCGSSQMSLITLYQLKFEENLWNSIITATSQYQIFVITVTQGHQYIASRLRKYISSQLVSIYKYLKIEQLSQVISQILSNN